MNKQLTILKNKHTFMQISLIYIVTDENVCIKLIEYCIGVSRYTFKCKITILACTTFHKKYIAFEPFFYFLAFFTFLINIHEYANEIICVVSGYLKGNLSGSSLVPVTTSYPLKLQSY